MKRRVYLSFHDGQDAWRAAQIRALECVEGNLPVPDREWAALVHEGEVAIRKWINDHLSKRSCTVVLIGRETAGRKWISYEIEKSWNEGKGLLGIYVHNLKNASGDRTAKGANPFSEFKMKKDGVTTLASIVKTYDPPYTMSTMALLYIKTNIQEWIEEAIRIRHDYKG